MEWKKKLVEAKDYEDAMEPLFYMGRFTGVAPFNLKRNNNQIKLELNYINSIVTLVWLGAYTYCTGIVVWNGEVLAGKVVDTTFLNTISYYKLCTFYVLIVVQFFNIVFKRHVYEMIVMSLKEIDTMVGYLGIPRDYNKIRMNHIVMSIGLEFLRFSYTMITLLSTYGWNQVGTLESFFLYQVPGYAISSTLILFACLTNIICGYLKVVKEQLIVLFDKTVIDKAIVHIKAMQKDYDGYISEKMEKNDTLERLHLIFKMYDKICSCSSIVNKCFGWNMSTVIGVSYISMIFNQFHVLISCIYLARGSSDFSDIVFILFSGLQLVSNIFITTVSIKSCNRCEQETNEIRKALGKIMIEESDDDISTKLHQLTSYLVMRYPKFSAMDLFYIDTALAFSMMGSATIYLIILVQLTIDTKYSKQ